MNEGTLQKHIKRRCKSLDILCYNFSSPARRGVPDLILVFGGRVVFVELKSPTGKGRLSDLQRHEISKLKDHGAAVCVISDVHKAYKLLEGIVNYDAPLVPEHLRRATNND